MSTTTDIVADEIRQVRTNRAHLQGLSSYSSDSQDKPPRALLLEISSRLQVSMDPEHLIRMFSKEVSRLVAHDSVCYECEELGIDLAIEESQTHSCSYNLSIESEVLGCIAFSRRKRFSPTEVEKIEYLLCSLVYPLRNTLMYQRAIKFAYRDALTGMQNRAAMENALPRELTLAHRHGQALSLLVMDLDLFKQINDKHGHAVGDKAICAVADCIRSCVRDSDLLFRYGGEEFVLCLSNTDHHGAMLLAERIRDAVDQMVCEVDEDTILDISLSIGVAPLLVGENPKSLFSRADDALYQAKENGRNCVISSSTKAYPCAETA